MAEKGRPERSPGREQQSQGRARQSQGRPDKPRERQPEDDEQIERVPIAFVGDDIPAQPKAPDDVRTEPGTDAKPAAKSKDGADYYVLWVKVLEDIQFAQNLFILKTLDGADAQINTAAEEGYWVYGNPYFVALLAAIDELRDEHRRAEFPPSMNFFRAPRHRCPSGVARLRSIQGEYYLIKAEEAAEDPR